MATKIAFLLLALIEVTSATMCMEYGCNESLMTNVCATWGSNQLININSNGCSSGNYCSAASMIVWAESTTDLSATYSCLLSPTSTTTPTFQNLTCHTKQPKKTFKSGATIAIACNSPSDCVLLDGSKANCVCAMRSDGYGTCEPDVSNDVIFAGYWDECGSDNMITSESAAAYWTAYMSYWVYDQSTASCRSIFSEMKAIQSAWDSYNAAEVLVLIGGFLL